MRVLEIVHADGRPDAVDPNEGIAPVDRQLHVAQSAWPLVSCRIGAGCIQAEAFAERHVERNGGRIGERECVTTLLESREAPRPRAGVGLPPRLKYDDRAAHIACTPHLRGAVSADKQHRGHPAALKVQCRPHAKSGERTSHAGRVGVKAHYAASGGVDRPDKPRVCRILSRRGSQLDAITTLSGITRCEVVCTLP
eukprot:967707-Prymnesium_polylepis.2